MASSREDDPPNSRLFILTGKGVTEDIFRDTFGKYGSIEDIWIVKDRRTNDDKGVVYIKFEKASEAALAMEEMNGRCLEGHPKPLKVLVASSKREGSTRDPREEEKLLRLFVIIPKSFTEADLRKAFEQYGNVDYVNVLRDKSSGDNKGFGYVKYHRAYHAALAFESCDPSFKPKFAEPKGGKQEQRDRDPYDLYNHDMDSDRGMKRGRRDMPWNDGDDYGGYYAEPGASRYSLGPTGPPMPPSPRDSQGPMELLSAYAHTGQQRIHITCPLGLTQGYLSRLFSLIPGLEYCDLNETTGVAYARYTTPQCAAYARDKLDGFEYPIGSKLYVRFADLAQPSDLRSSSHMGYGNDSGPHTIHKAAMVLEKAGINPDSVLGAENITERVTYCNISLPRPQALKPEDTDVTQRLFIVCQPNAVPERILRDAFCRFGNLIDVYLLSGRNYGYAKYATKESAVKAIQNLHGQSVAGQRLKVLEAEAPRGPGGNDERDRDRPSKKARI